MQWTLGRSCSRFLFLSRVWLFKRETRLAARFPLLVAKPSGPCARPTRRETTSIGKSNENRQTLCKFHNTTATNCVLCQRRYYSAESNGDAFVSLRVQSIIVLQPNCCQQWNRSITYWSCSSAHTKTYGSAGFVNIDKSKYGTRTVPRPTLFADQTSTKKSGVKYWTQSMSQMFKMEVNHICHPYRNLHDSDRIDHLMRKNKNTPYYKNTGGGYS